MHDAMDTGCENPASLVCAPVADACESLPICCCLRRSGRPGSTGACKQENRSFDSSSGAYPGADGISLTNGAPAVYVRTRARVSVSDPLTIP